MFQIRNPKKQYPVRIYYDVQTRGQKDSEKYINDAYTESIKSIVEKSESITRDNQQKLNQKITNDILDVLQNELYPLNIDEPTETVTFIDRNEIRAHINLLTRLRLANNQ